MEDLTPITSDSASNGQAMPGPEHDPMIAAIREANHIMAGYGRHFAGKPRATRDLRMLDELHQRLQTIHQRLTTLPDLRERARSVDRVADLERQCALLRDERAHVVTAQGSGTVAERAGSLAMRIDEQLLCYRTHIAGHTRLSRRPRLIHRIIGNLEDIHAALREPDFDSLEQGAGVARNRALIADNLTAMRRELAMVELEHQASSPMERAAALGMAANSDIRAYNLYFAGQDRATRDLALLGQICDRLAEIEHQLADMLRGHRSEAICRSLDAVQISLDLYETEYEQIQRLRAPAGTPA